MVRAACSLAVLLLVLGGGMAAAGEQEDHAAARKAGAAVLAKLPAPTPAISFRYEGDLIIQDLWAGELRLSVRIARVGRDWVWRITEDSFLDWAGGEVREKLMVHAGKDLAVIGGTYERSDREGTVSMGFSRGKDGFDIERRTKKGETWGKPEKLVMAVPPGGATGLASAMLFLRAAKPSKGATYALPFVGTASFKDPTGARPDHLLLSDRGPATLEIGKASFKTCEVGYAHGATQWTLHVARDRRTLIGAVSPTGPVKIVPKGLGGERVTADPREPPTTWKKAFLKFGFGYHTANEELLAEAFHWDRMWEYETKTLKRWPKDQPVSAFKAAWIKEFVAGSKHRDIPATRRLLSMTLATGKIKKQTDDAVVFWAHPNFGGGTQRTYYLERQGERWGIVRIDF